MAYGDPVEGSIAKIVRIIAEREQDIPKNLIGVVATLDGRVLSRSSSATTIWVTTSLKGRAVPGSVTRGEVPIEVVTFLKGEFLTEHPKTNWVGWSKIGDIRFVQDQTNDSGYRPMAWKGWVYAILPLGKNPIVYGSGGITKLNPVINPSPTFGADEIATFGIKNRTAVCGSLTSHFFIDKKGVLWSLNAEGIERLGYQEFLAPLVNPAMFYDPEEQQVIISDSGEGYILTLSGLGGGYPAITGIQYSEGLPIITSPNVLESPSPMMVVTDIMDFEERGMKTLEWVQVGTDLTKGLYVAIDYRYSKNEPFKTTPYRLVNKEGVAHVRTAGVEFRVRLKTEEYEYVEIDYLHFHYTRTDKRFNRTRPDGRN